MFSVRWTCYLRTISLDNNILIGTLLSSSVFPNKSLFFIWIKHLTAFLSHFLYQRFSLFAKIFLSPSLAVCYSKRWNYKSSNKLSPIYGLIASRCMRNICSFYKVKMRNFLLYVLQIFVDTVQYPYYWNTWCVLWIKTNA